MRRFNIALITDKLGKAVYTAFLIFNKKYVIIYYKIKERGDIFMFNMFDLTDNIMTPMEMTVLMSEEYADQIIKTFKERWIGYGIPSQFLSDIAQHS